MVRRLAVLLVAVCAVAATSATASAAEHAERAEAGHDAEGASADRSVDPTFESLERLRRLEPSVGRVESPNGWGTGWVVRDGMVVTNLHVTRNTAWDVRVRFPRFVADCYVAAGSADYDLAVLRCDTRGLEPLPINLATGAPDTPIAVIGYPQGVGPTLTTGVMTGERLEVGRTPTVGFDAEIHPGSSGSPVLDVDGNVRAVATFGGGYGVPARELGPLIDTAQGAPATRRVAEWRVRLIRTFGAVGLTAVFSWWRARRTGREHRVRYVVGWTTTAFVVVTAITELQFLVFGPVRLI